MHTTPDSLIIPYRLKEINRKGTVGNRFESTAEHTYSTMMLAAYYLRFYPDIDTDRVYRIILYHDLVEVHAGDTFILDENMRKTKIQRESNAFNKLLGELPLEIAGELKTLWPEYEYGSTKEARFAKAIDELDPMLHSLYKPEEWQRYGFTEKKLRAKKEKHFKEFPHIKKMFNMVITRLLNDGSITKK